MRDKRNPPARTEGQNKSKTRATSSKSTAQNPTPRKRKARETWRAVPGMKGVRVSSCGRVKGAPVVIREGRRTVRGRSVARCVWRAFRGEVEPGFEIHHIDRDRSNDSLANLACLSRREHAIADGRKPGFKFEPWEVAEAFIRRRRGQDPDTIERLVGVSWRGQRHYFENKDRRPNLLAFLESGVHPGGQLDAFGPMLDRDGKEGAQ